MNRVAPCEVCGCPLLFHAARPDPQGGPARRVCESCSRELGRDRDCGPAD